MNVRGLIFDCDGTLVDSLGYAMASFNHALDQLGEAPRPPEMIKRYFGAGADRILINVLGDEKKGLAAFEHYLIHQGELARSTQLHAGIRELIDRAHAAGLKMAIVTGRHSRDLELVLGPHTLHDYFVTQIADDHIPRSKPAPDGILLAAKRMGLSPAETAYVGDSTMDMEAARAAGSIAIAALWDGLADAKAMKAAGADHLAQTPADVWRILESL